MTVHLLEFLDVTAIDALIRKQISKLIERKSFNLAQEKPLVTTILNDIQM